jgi:hypothetical protein
MFSRKQHASFAYVTLARVMCIKTVVDRKMLASEAPLFLIISSETMQKLSGESSTFFLQINYSSSAYTGDGSPG